MVAISAQPSNGGDDAIDPVSTGRHAVGVQSFCERLTCLEALGGWVTRAWGAGP